MELTGTSNTHWYAIYVKCRHEFKVVERLTKAEIESFLPTVERLNRWKDRKKLVSFPLFPGYLFVHINNTPTEKLSVLKTQGVVRFVGLPQGEPEPVPEEQVNSLMILVANKADINPYPYLTEGQRVRIKYGPFAGVEGVLVERLGQHMLVLSVDVLQRGAALKVAASEVEKV